MPSQERKGFSTKEMEGRTFKRIRETMEARYVPEQWEVANRILNNYGVTEQRPRANGKTHNLRETRGLVINLGDGMSAKVFLREVEVKVEDSNIIQIVFQFSNGFTVPNHVPEVLKKGSETQYKYKQLLEIIEAEERKRALNPEYSPYIFIAPGR